MSIQKLRESFNTTSVAVPRELVAEALNEIERLEAALRDLRALASEYVEAESAYHKAHKNGEAGPGVCIRANDACAKLRAALAREPRDGEAERGKE